MAEANTSESVKPGGWIGRRIRRRDGLEDGGVKVGLDRLSDDQCDRLAKGGCRTIGGR